MRKEMEDGGLGVERKKKGFGGERWRGVEFCGKEE